MAECEKCLVGRIYKLVDGELVSSECPHCKGPKSESAKPLSKEARTYSYADIVNYCEHSFRAGYSFASVGGRDTDEGIKRRVKNIVG